MKKGKSVIQFPNEYICLDVETTGLDLDADEIIEISALKIADGNVVDKFASLVRPNSNHGFIPYNEFSAKTFEEVSCILESNIISVGISELTGISNEMLVRAPHFKDIAEDLKQFLENYIIVGQNITFDINFLDKEFSKCDLSICNDHVNIVRIARKLFPELKNHKLSEISEFLGTKNRPSHRAYSDALATYECFEIMKGKINDEFGYENFIALFKKKQSQSINKSFLDAMSPSKGSTTSSNLSGKTVVFTGTLSTMTRRDALQLVVDNGGIPSDTLTKKTNYLVVGKEDFAKSIKNGKTSKMKKADSYRNAGLDITTVSEDDFFDMIFKCTYDNDK